MSKSRAMKHMVKRVLAAAEKRKADRNKSISNKDAMSFVLAFLKEVDNLKKSGNDKIGGLVVLMGLWVNTLEKQIQTIDPDASVKVNANESNEVSVTITWSDEHCKQNNVDKECTIDTTAFLFSDI